MTHLLTNLSKVRKFQNLYKLPWSDVPPQKCTIPKSFKILLLNAPCNGFGDLIFVKKLADYLRKSFKIHVTIATTEPDKLLMLGEDKRYLKKLASDGNGTETVKPCRVFHGLRLYGRDGKKQENTEGNYDLFFVAPLSFDYSPKISDVKPLVPNATKFNTFFFSEYNDTLRKDFDFHTGIGAGRDGILLTTPIIESESKINRLVNRSKLGPFALIYIADLDRAQACVKGFLELISKKYNHNKRFQIIIPSFLYAKSNWFTSKSFISKTLGKYWGDIDIKGPDGHIIKGSGTGTSSLTIRADILPVKNNTMMGLIRNSVKDILLTGDQSITDALSCCHNKNIFYQIAPWKTDFGKEMAKAMPNKYLAKASTSCGNLSAIHYKSSYGSFVKKQNFFKNVHDRLKAIVCMAVADRNKNSDIHEFITAVNESKTTAMVKKKLGAPPTRKSKRSRRKSKRKPRK